MKTTVKRINSEDLALHANGIPPAQCEMYEAIARHAIKAGCNRSQAVALAKLTYFAVNRFHWNIMPAARGLEIQTKYSK